MLARANDGPYPIEAVAEEKVLGNGVAGTPRVRVFERDGGIRGVSVTCGKYLRILAVDRDFRRRGIGTALLHDANAKVIAAEAGNYFTPGVDERDAGTIEFFRVNGYRQTGSTWNLHAVIRDSGFGIRHLPESRIANPESLVPFVLREFGPSWAFEIRRAAAAFFIDGVGFAVIEANNRGLGTFGPMGIVESMRGRGYGKQLLLVCLAALHRLGYERAIIPWTDALDFYRTRCGAEPAHRFLTFARS